MTPADKSITEGLITYFTESDQAYRNWTQVPPGMDIPHALHTGFHPDGTELGQFESITTMNNLLIGLLDIPSDVNAVILDAGCGVGNLSFEIASELPQSKVFGLNITQSQTLVASDYANRQRLRNLHYVIGDYTDLPFQVESFDRIIFCESLCHALKQEAVLRSAYRTLKRRGKILLSDVMLMDRNLTEQEQAWISDLRVGWFMTELRTREELTTMLTNIGLTKVNTHMDITANTFPSAKRLGINSAARLQEPQSVSPIITESRKAAVALYRLMETGKLRYHLTLLEK